MALGVVKPLDMSRAATPDTWGVAMDVPTKGGPTYVKPSLGLHEVLQIHA
jgi:hypothetical protein